MALLLDRRDDQITIIEEAVKAAAGNWHNGKEIMALLPDRRGEHVTISDEMMSIVARRFGKDIMAVLLVRQGDQIPVTKVVGAAAGNVWNGKEDLALFLDRCRGQITIMRELDKDKNKLLWPL
ncbi:hypothetical protein CI238_11437 [Colletotrichum incanum]|uniref:Uncharacterized protein n=1 Tax=Colletotrichum incanum TaxID=1573173 RepID=A0A161W908_COLIC|nr:hypothetical protein CI238_11437 [Colletotrichum incanum]